MRTNRSSSAADFMAILNNNNKRKDNDVANDFASLFSAALEGASGEGQFRDTPLGDLFGFKTREMFVPNTTYSECVRSPVTESTAWRQSDAYAEFRDKFLNPDLPKYTADMYSTDDYGIKNLNAKGQDQLNQWRIDNIKSMAPESIEDAERKFQAGYDHFNNYIHTQFKDQGLEMEFDYVPHANPSGDYFFGLVMPAKGPTEEEQRRKFNEFLKSDSGKEMQVMAEEVQFYGAISELAKINSDFRKAYEEDPEAALDTYHNQISKTMQGIKLPRVQTIPDNWVQMAGVYR